MLGSIKELQDYIIGRGHRFDDPVVKRRFMMTSPGCSKKEIEELTKSLPTIPESYTKWIKAVNLNGISVGYFEVSPGCYNSDGIVASLIKCNQEDTRREYAKARHLYFIGTRDGFEVYVATAGGTFQEGEIILISNEIWGDKEHPERWIYRLAKDFEQFLIAAGNLNQIHREIKDCFSKQEVEEKEREFFKRLKILGVSEEYYSAWRSVFL